jgi:tetratricopeptide (TPR) repeat protein
VKGRIGPIRSVTILARYLVTGSVYCAAVLPIDFGLRRYALSSKTIGFYRMPAPLRNYIFPRALALRLSVGLCSPNAFQSRYFARAELLAHRHQTRPRGSFHTKRRRHLTIPAPFNGQLILQFHIDFVSIVSPHIGFASSTTPHSIASDPAEEEALLCLEQGTQKLEEGDVEGAKKLYQRSVDIKRNASSLFNLGVTHYHLSSYSKLIVVAIWNSTPFEEEFDKAIHSWTSAIELQPSSADAHTSSHASSSSDSPYPNMALHRQTWRAPT